MVSEVLRDSPFTTFARSTLGGVVLVVAALVVVVAWVSRPRHKDRRVAAAAAVCAPVLLVVLNVILGKLGVWQSTLYTLPPVALVSTTVLFVAAVTVVMLLILSGYRAAASRGRRAALTYSLLLVVIIAALIVLIDTVALTEHYVAFGYGYTIWMDVVVGVVTPLAGACLRATATAQPLGQEQVLWLDHERAQESSRARSSPSAERPPA